MLDLKLEQCLCRQTSPTSSTQAAGGGVTLRLSACMRQTLPKPRRPEMPLLHLPWCACLASPPILHRHNLLASITCPSTADHGQINQTNSSLLPTLKAQVHVANMIPCPLLCLNLRNMPIARLTCHSAAISNGSGMSHTSLCLQDITRRVLQSMLGRSRQVPAFTATVVLLFLPSTTSLSCCLPCTEAKRSDESQAICPALA